MAKELPYFKFEPAEWQNGSVQMLEPAYRAMYLDICCAYWLRLGDLPYAFALQKHCGGNTEALQMMLKYALVDRDQDENLTIDWLDEQLDDRQTKSAKASESARKRWDKTKDDANAMRTHSERNANRREEKRKEEKRIEENKEEVVIDSSESFEEFWNLYDHKKGKDAAFKKWQKISKRDKEKIMEVLPSYVVSTPDKQYRKHPATWLNGKCWNDEIQIHLNNETKQQAITDISRAVRSGNINY